MPSPQLLVGDKQQDTTPTAHSSAVPLPLAPLLQLPATVLQLVFLHLPWHERLLHAGLVHRQLPPASLLWTEHDHVRLSEALLVAVEQLHPSASAVHCCCYVRSLCVEREMDEQLLAPTQQHSALSTARSEGCDSGSMHAPTRLLSCLQQLQQHTLSQPATATQPFVHLRSLIVSVAVFQCLLDCGGGLPHLHSLSLRSAIVKAEDRASESEMLSWYLSSRPALRRLRVNGVRVRYDELFALPAVEQLDVRRARLAGSEQPVSVACPQSLRHLLLSHDVKLGWDRMQAGHVLASLSPHSARSVSVKGRLTNDDMRTLSTLHSLTALAFIVCHFHGTNALSALMSEHAEPLLPSLYSFAIAHSDCRDMRTTIPAFLTAYSRQLRHIKLIVIKDRDVSFQAVLSVVVSSMPQLESLELAVRDCRFDAEVVNNLLPSPAVPTLPALRSLALANLLMSDAAVDQLLSCCPQLLELTLDRVVQLTAAVCTSLLRCRQLLSFVCSPASEMATDAAFARAVRSSSSAARRSTVAFPYLSHHSLTFNQGCFDLRGFARLLGLFDGAPISSLSLELPHNATHHSRYVRQLALLPHLTALRLVADGSDCVGLLKQHSVEQRWSSEQHAVNMRYYWQDGLLGEGEAELRARYAAGVKVPGTSQGCSGWRVFRRAQSERDEGDRVRFFRSLGTESGPISCWQ